VAADVGIAKASLYKHFASKEDLAAAAMIQVLDRARDFIDSTEAAQPDATPVERLRAVVRWALQAQLAGDMPLLPAQNSALRRALVGNKAYMDRVVEVSDRLGAWILQAQQRKEINPALPPDVVLFTLYARACDPVPGVLKATGQYDDTTIIDHVLTTCFSGLSGA
jgi:AcrR family transcriptional regulator